MRVRRAAELGRTFHANKGVEYASDESEDEREIQKRKKIKTEPWPTPSGYKLQAATQPFQFFGFLNSMFRPPTKPCQKKEVAVVL